MNFSEKLAMQRKANNLSQEQLADAMGVTRQSVSKWESGESYPDMAKIIQLCKILNCSLNDIMEDGVMGEIKNSDEQRKDNILELFLRFITNISNMFAHMSVSSVIKMIIEMVIVGILISGFGFIIYSLIEIVLYQISEIISFRIIYYVRDILLIIVEILTVLICAMVFFYVFKIRYLDYYVTIIDQNVDEQSVEEPIDENKINNELKHKNGKEIIVIRDPKHSNSRFVEIVSKIVKIIIKLFILQFVIPFIFGFGGSIFGTIFLIIQKGKVFKEAAIVCLGLAIFCATIIYLIYNFLFNRKQNHIILLSGILGGILIAGLSLGLVVNTIYHAQHIGGSPQILEDLKTETYEIDLNINDTLDINAENIEYVVVDDFDGVTKIEFEMAQKGIVYEYVLDRGDGYKEYNYYFSYPDIEELKEFMNDLANNQYHSFYNTKIFKATIYSSGEIIDVLKNEDRY